MSDEKKISEGELLYDPMFAKKPELDWKDSEKGGLFGKAIVKKTVFILVLLIAIGGSLFFSFNSLSKAKFEYEGLDDGTYKLMAFHGQKNDTVLNVDYVRSEDGKADESKTVTAVKQFAVTGNDTLQFVFIGKDVKEIEKTAFYYCTSLCAVYVDDANENYTDIDGVLYKKENGKVTEALLCPQQYTRFRVAIALGETEPKDAEEALAVSQKFKEEDYIAKLDEVVNGENTKTGKSYVIPKTVKKIDQLCFAYCDKFTSIKLPAGLTEIETMAFFKCSSLEAIDLPDTLETIGSDAFGKCGKITYLFIPKSVTSIGHHAFWDCGGIEKVYLEAPSSDGIETGSNWAPQYRKVFMKDCEKVINEERTKIYKKIFIN